jgi:TonB family protein
LDFNENGRGYVPVSDKAREIIRELKRNPGRIVPAGELDELPEPLSRRPPDFPISLLNDGEGGRAVIEFFLDEAGYVELPHVVESSKPEFGYAAVQAVAAWRFQPPRRQGKGVITRLQVPFNFAAPPPSAKPAGSGERP